MGLTQSSPQTDRAKVNKIETVTKLAELNLNEIDDLLDSLNITEFNRVNIKEPLPIIGGQYSDFNHYDQDEETEEESDDDFDDFEDDEEESFDDDLD